MNERIRELARAAKIYAEDQHPGGFPNEDLLVVEDFAKSIVRNCIEELEISKKGDIYTGELFNCEWNDCIDSQIAMLKEEFGLDS